MGERKGAQGPDTQKTVRGQRRMLEPRTHNPGADRGPTDPPTWGCCPPEGPENTFLVLRAAWLMVSSTGCHLHPPPPTSAPAAPRAAHFYVSHVAQEVEETLPGALHLHLQEVVLCLLEREGTRCPGWVGGATGMAQRAASPSPHCTPSHGIGQGVRRASGKDPVASHSPAGHRAASWASARPPRPSR